MSQSETRSSASGTGGEAADADATGIPVSYWWWLSGITVSLLGSQVQAFGLGWVATAHGASLAALVITAGNVPGLVLMLIGGAVADSRGPWLVMVVSDGLMCGITAALAVTAAFLGTPVWLLLSAAVLTGVSNAFYVPSSGTIPRRLVPGAALGKAMAARTMAGQLVSTLGSPVGGVVVVVAGLAGAAGLNSASFAVIFVLLLVARRRFAVEASPAARSGTLLRRALAGAGLVARDSLLRPLVAIVAAVALCMLPVMSLLVPLLVRSRGWPASAAGEVLGAEAVISGVVIVLVLVRGTSRRPGVALCAGVALAGLGTCGLGVAGSLPLMLVVSGVMGAGLGLFGTHVAPLVLGGTPAAYLSRVQAVLTLCQTVPLIVGLNAGGLLVSGAGVRGALLTMGGVVCVVGALAVISRSVRHASIGAPEGGGAA